MRLTVSVFALSLLAAPAMAQQSPSNTGTPVVPEVTTTPGTGSATTNKTAVGKGTKTVMQSPHKNVSFHSRFMAAAGTDGHLTLDEAKQAKFTLTTKHFAEIDKDNKGYVTYDEVTGFFRQNQNPTAPSRGN